MNINLRKAKALQNSIQETMRSIRIELNVELNEFQDPGVELKRHNDQIFANDARRQQLLLAFYNIRGLVGTANSNCGIDLNLAKAAFIDKRVAQLEEFLSVQPMPSMAVIEGMLQKIRNRVDEARPSIYGRSDGYTTSAVTQEQIEQARLEIKNLKKEKQKLNDLILELNIKTEIPLSDEVVETLKKENLI